MILRTIGLLLALLVLGHSGEARAWTFVGTTEEIRRIQNVDLVGPDGVALFLGHKISTVYFIGGVALSDDGYVLGLRSNPRQFLDMPPPDILADFQGRGLLPDPLPPYGLGILDYLRGYSLWIVLLAAITAYVGVILGRRRPRRSS